MIRNLTVFLYALFRLLYSVVFVNYVFYRKRLHRAVKNIYQQKQLPFDPSYFRRIFFHTLLGSITNEWFTTLRGRRQTTQESRAGFYLGAATAVFDDLFDRLDFTSKESIEDLAQGHYKYDSIAERLSKLFYDGLLDNLSEPNCFQSYLQKVGHFQEESKKQLGIKLSTAALRQITFEKGGYSLGLYRSILGHPYPEPEKKAVYNLGRLVQLTDDVFDLRIDHLEKIQTLATTSKDIRLLREEYFQLARESYQEFQQLDYPPKQVRRFWAEVMIILSRGMVCLDQLVRVQQEHGDEFMIHQYGRAELVCDMERPINLLRSFWYCLSWKYD
ncbi:MAG: hypothetical protein AAF985_02415 [Bacteroidota bacterium]